MNVWGAASLRKIGVNMHALPLKTRPLRQQQCMHFVSAFGERGGQVFELARKILVEKKYLQS
jgi:hypothetical protein